MTIYLDKVWESYDSTLSKWDVFQLDPVLLMVTEDKWRKKLEPNITYVIKILAKCLRQHFPLRQLSDRSIDNAKHYDTLVTLRHASNISSFVENVLTVRN